MTTDEVGRDCILDSEMALFSTVRPREAAPAANAVHAAHANMRYVLCTLCTLCMLCMYRRLSVKFHPRGLGGELHHQRMYCGELVRCTPPPAQMLRPRYCGRCKVLPSLPLLQLAKRGTTAMGAFKGHAQDLNKRNAKPDLRCSSSHQLLAKRGHGSFDSIECFVRVLLSCQNIAKSLQRYVTG